MKPTPAPLPDDEIVALYFARNEVAITETDRKYGHYLTTIAMNILHNRQDSEECLNDTYLRTWNAVPPTVPQILGAYLARIVRNLSLDRYEQNQRSVPRMSEDFSDFEGFLAESDPYSEAQLSAVAAIIDDYLATVTPRRRYIFVSRFFCMTPVATIARKLLVGTATVNRELAAIRDELRQALKKEDFDV